MEIHASRDISDFNTVNSNFICLPGRSWDLDRVCPVIVVVAEAISKVENCVFGDG
jgi:hypothetical protein